MRRTLPDDPPGATRRARLLRAAVAAGVAVSLGSVTYLTGAWSGLEGATVDARFGLRSAEPPDDVAVVGIDDATFSELRTRWPFPRSLHARAIDRLRAAGVRKIVYDVQFTEPTTPREDLALYRAVARARGVVLATTEVDRRGHTNVLGGDANLERVHARAAASNLPPDDGGVLRRLDYTEGGLTTLAVAVAEDVRAHRVPHGPFERGGAWIDYRGPPGTIPSVSFSRVVQGDFDPRALRGKVVVIGASAPTLQDVHPTPTGKELMSGPEIQANAIWTAMHGFPLRRAPRWLALLAIAAFGLLMPMCWGVGMVRLRWALAAPLIGGAYALVAHLAFLRGVILPVTYPMTALAFGTIATVTIGYFTESRERRRIARYSELLEREVRDRTQELRDTQIEIVRRLGQAVESRDRDTGAHIERISRLCYRLGLGAGLSREEAELLRNASALHDLGKIGVPDRILGKPGELTPEEREVMKDHTTIGAAILAGSRLPLVQMAELIALTHHERWDGEGYPRGLRGEEIPLAGRICAICDVYDALISDRAYKERWSPEAALAEIEAESGRAFDPRLVDLFVKRAAEMDLEQRPTEAPSKAPEPSAVVAAR